MLSWLNQLPFMSGFSTRHFSRFQIRGLRVGLWASGILWILIASTLCGCGTTNGWMKNQAGRAYYRQGNYAAARSEFERALMDNPQRASYAYNVARTMEKQGDTSGSEQLYQHALSLNPSHRPSYAALSEKLGREGRSDEARQLVGAWAYTQPYNTASKVEASKVERRVGNLAGAEQQLSQALKDKPGNPMVRREMRSLNREMGRPTGLGSLAMQQSLNGNPYYQSMQGTIDPMTGVHPSPAQHMVNMMPQIDSTYPSGVIQGTYQVPAFGMHSGVMPASGMMQPMQMQGVPVEGMQMQGSPMMVPSNGLQAPYMDGMPMEHQLHSPMGPTMMPPSSGPQPTPAMSPPSAGMQPHSVQYGPITTTPVPGIPVINEGMQMAPANYHQMTPVPPQQPAAMQMMPAGGPVPSPYPTDGIPLGAMPYGQQPMQWQAGYQQPMMQQGAVQSYGVPQMATQLPANFTPAF